MAVSSHDGPRMCEDDKRIQLRKGDVLEVQMDSILRKLYVLTLRIGVLDDLVRDLVAKEGNCDPSIRADHPDLTCPRCEKMYRERRRLETLFDYAGGGSHYWHCLCSYCRYEYYFDNHSNELQER